MTSLQSRTDAFDRPRSPAEGLPERSYPGFFSSAKSFALPTGTRFGPEGVSGYYIDLRVKAEEAGVAACIAGTTRGPALGASAPVGPGRVRALPRRRGRAVASQRDGGGRDTRSSSRCAGVPATACGSTACLTRRRSSCRPGGPRRWRRERARACSCGCISQPARSAGPTPRGVPWRRCACQAAEGGVQARLGDGPWPEEYPTDPPSYVLNGGIFALWGLYDVGEGAGRRGRPRASSRREPTRWRRTSTAGTRVTGRATTCSRIP